VVRLLIGGMVRNPYAISAWNTRLTLGGVILLIGRVSK